MRTSNLGLTQQILFEINRSFSRLNSSRLQLSSGKQINGYADDPRGVGALRRYSTLQTANDQYLKNAGSARGFLEAADSALQGVGTSLTRLRELLLQETGPLANADSRANAAVEVQGLRDTVLDLMNQQVEGSYIFGGYVTNRPPFSLSGSDVVYSGDANAQSVQVGPGLRVPVTVPGSELLGSSLAVLAGRGDFQPRLTAGAALSELNEGAGVDLAKIKITDGVGASAEIDLSGASTVQDVLDAINAAGLGVTARIADDEKGLVLDGAGPLAVAEVDGRSTARNLGLLGSTQNSSLSGTDIRAALTLNTDFSQIASLDGKLPLGTLRVRTDGNVTDVDLSAASSFNDVRAAISGLLPGMDLTIQGGALQLSSTTGKAFQVESPPNDPTAVDLGLVGSGAPGRLFDLFRDVVDALKGNDTEKLKQSLAEVSGVHANILDRNVAVGARQNSLDQAEQLLRARGESLDVQRSRVEDIDVAEVATRLSFAETQYQAALASSARLFSLSLMNYL